MKKGMMVSAAALLLALAACGAPAEGGSQDDGAAGGGVRKDDCYTVYAEVVAVNGDNLTVSAGDRVFSLAVDTDILMNWEEGDAVVLYYTGEFGEDMQVHYIDKWTENSEVQPPEGVGKESQTEKGGSVVGG